NNKASALMPTTQREVLPVGVTRCLQCSIQKRCQLFCFYPQSADGCFQGGISGCNRSKQPKICAILVPACRFVCRYCAIVSRCINRFKPVFCLKLRRLCGCGGFIPGWHCGCNTLFDISQR